MGFAFNPFTGNFDQKGSGGGGGGSSYIDGEVQNFSALPQTIGSPAVDSAYLVREAEGAWLLNRKPAGIYIRTANTGVRADDWTHAGAFPDVFSDANFLLYDNGDSTKNLQFQLSGIAAATTRTITMPDANVTLPDQGTSTGDTPTFAKVTINDTVNEQSTLTLSDEINNNKIEFATQELTLRHTGTNDTPYINVTDGTDSALLGVRQGEMFLQGSNAVVRIEQSGGGLADIKVRALVVEDATTEATATFDADENLTANRTYDLPDASGTIALLETLPGGTKTYAVFTATDAQPVSTNFATLDTRGTSLAVLDFDGAATNEETTFVGVIPEGADLSSGLKVRIFYMMTSATSGVVRWGAQWEKWGTANGSDDFDTATEANSTVSATSGIEVVCEITCTAIDSLAAGDRFRLKIYRDASDTTNDTASGDAELVAVEVRSAA